MRSIFYNLATGLVLLMGLSAIFVQFYPFKIMTYGPITLDTKTVKQGEIVYYTVPVTKHRQILGKLNKMLVSENSEHRYNLLCAEGSLPKGKHNISTGSIIPIHAYPGRYKIVATSTYELPFWRIVEESYETPYFTVEEAKRE